MSAEDEQLGKMLLERGLLSPDEYQDAEDTRRTTNRPLSEILVEKAYLSMVQVQDAMAALQKRVRFCSRCNVPVYVTRIMAEGERCPRCLNRVQWQEESVVAQIRDLESLVQLTKDELPPDVQAARRQPGHLFGKYILVKEIGRGGAGVVQKAWDTMLGEYVALKFIRELKPESSKDTEAKRQRQEQILDLLQEARAALRLRHEHIVAIRDIGRIDQQFYIAMDYIEGETLVDHVKASQARGRLSPLYEDPAYYLGIVRDIANAIHYAHTFPKPIVHCDLKPGNVLMSRGGTAYVMDFGLARVLGGGKDGEGDERVRGTPAYMAPEQLSGRSENIGAWTDTYALGAILYELLTGRPPFTGEQLEVMLKAMRDRPERPTKVIEKTSERDRQDTTKILTRISKLEEICLKCLAKDPSDRFDTARTLAGELAGVLEAVEKGHDTGILPPKLRQAQERSELHKVDEHITHMDLEMALQETEALSHKRDTTRLQDRLMERRRHVMHLQKLRTRLVTLINAQRPVFREFRLANETLENVELMKATEEMLYVLLEEGPREIEWSRLRASQVVAMAEEVKMHGPEDLLALGILCHHSRLVDLSVRYLTSLKGTPYEEEARRVMETTA